MWNGGCYFSNPVFAGDRFSADYFETDFAQLPGVARLGLSRAGCLQRLRHGGAALQRRRIRVGRDGRAYRQCQPRLFPSGTPDLDDIQGAVDIAGSVVREVLEETGLALADYRLGASGIAWCRARPSPWIRILQVDAPGEALRVRIEANLAGQDHAELAAIRLVRGTADLTAAMPRFVTAFIEARMAAPA